MPAVDLSAKNNPGLNSSATGGEVVVPHAANEQTFISRALYVGVAGDVTALMMDDTVVQFKAMPVGIHAIRAKRINAVGTTATNMLFLK